MEAEKRDPFGKGDPSHVFMIPIVDIASVAYRQGMVNREMQAIYVGAH